MRALAFIIVASLCLFGGPSLMAQTGTFSVKPKEEKTPPPPESTPAHDLHPGTVSIKKWHTPWRPKMARVTDNRRHNHLFAQLTQGLRMPDDAMNAGVCGEVRVRFVIDNTGQVSNVEITDSLDARIDGALTQALRGIDSLPIPFRRNQRAQRNPYEATFIFASPKCRRTSKRPKLKKLVRKPALYGTLVHSPLIPDLGLSYSFNYLANLHRYAQQPAYFNTFFSFRRAGWRTYRSRKDEVMVTLYSDSLSIGSASMLIKDTKTIMHGYYNTSYNSFTSFNFHRVPINSEVMIIAYVGTEEGTKVGLEKITVNSDTTINWLLQKPATYETLEEAFEAME